MGWLRLGKPHKGAGSAMPGALAMTTVLATVLALALGGCAAQPGTPKREPDKGGAGSYTLIWGRPLTRQPGDGIVLDRPGGSSTLTVTSASGVGGALFQPTSGTWPRELRLEFRYAPDRPFTALEGLTLQTPANSFDSTADWQTLKLPDLPMRRSAGQFWFTLPEDWLVDQRPLKLEWVDRHR